MRFDFVALPLDNVTETFGITLVGSVVLSAASLAASRILLNISSAAYGEDTSTN